MCLHRLDNRCHLDQLAKSLSSVLGHRQLLSKSLVHLLYALAVCVRNINDLSTVYGEKLLNVGTRSALGTFLPVVAVDNVIRMQRLDHIVVKHIILHHDLAYAGKGAVELHSLTLRCRRELRAANHLAVAQASDDYAAVLRRMLENIQMSVVDHIRSEACVNCFHVILSPFYSLLS